MKVAIVGITGLVGIRLSWLLEKRKFPITQIIPIASKKSAGKKIIFKNKEIAIITLEKFIENINYQDNIVVFFTSSKEISQQYIPKILNKNKNIWIIDNSSEYRMDPSVPLIIPEINSNKICKKNKLISNPNCSTAQLVMVLYPLHKKYKIKRVVVSTYQSVSGAGHSGLTQLHNERLESMSRYLNIPFINNTKIKSPFPYKIDQNCIPFCDILDNNTGYTREEIKLEKETVKILDENIKITSTAVRVPVVGGHSESVNIEFENEYKLQDLINILNTTIGICVKEGACPKDISMETDIWVSRIRRDFSQDKSVNLWIVADNLMKGAALNAIQIAETLLEKKYIK